MNYILIVVVLLAAGIGVYYYIKNKQNQELEETIEMDDKTYTLERMTAFVKQRLNEITKVNLYDIGLSEEELKRRKNKKYELKKALKGCTYGDVNDKKYIKELIYDLLYREYGVDETNVSKAIPFDIPSLLTAQDKFDILIYMYKNDFGYEALTELIKKYNLAELKYVAGETKPCYVITSQEISDIFEKENFVLTLSDKINVIVQRIYQHYKGYSSIDEVRDMNIAVVHRGQAEVGLEDGLFHAGERAAIPGLDGDGAAIRYGDGRELADGRGRAVVINLDVVHKAGGGAAGAEAAEVAIQRAESLVHTIFGIQQDAFFIHNA